MVYLKWVLLALCDITMNFVAIFLSPVVAAWSVIARDPAPRIFAWLYTHDDDLDGNHPLYLPVPTNPIKLWWNRTCWICRNPSYGFAAYVLGLKIDEVTVETTQVGNGWTDTFYKNGKVVGFGYRRILSKWDIWLGWARPSHDGKHYMIKVKVKRR